MEAIGLLHNAARHYCINRAAIWRNRYAELSAAGRATIKLNSLKWTYTDDAYRVFPRYLVLDAILREVESFVPADFASLDEARALLHAAGETAQNESTRFVDPIAVAATQDERYQFTTYMDHADMEQCALIPQLPFRRVLTTAQRQKWHEAFVAQWGKWYGGYTKCQDTPPYVTLHTAVMDHPNAYDHLRRALVDHGITRLLELCEWDPGYELDTNAAEFRYGDGGEGIWTATDLTWMVYASHESSITFGGSWLIERMQASLCGVERYRYKGWDISTY